MEFVQTRKNFGYVYFFEFRYGPHHGGEIGKWCIECLNPELDGVDRFYSCTHEHNSVKSAYSETKDQGLIN